jgi:hypothetical protein
METKSILKNLRVQKLNDITKNNLTNIKVLHSF